MILFSALPFLLSVASAHVMFPSYLTGEVLVEFVNNVQDLWTAGEPVFPKERLMKRLMKVEHIAAHPQDQKQLFQLDVAENIPESYDVRDHYPNCISVNNIRDQSDCGSCWAFAAAEAISDRTCIASNGTINTLLSAEDLLSCCSTCGDGCEGGYPIRAWQYWAKNGISTGGSYESQFGCKPYSIAPCGETIDGVKWPACPKETEPTPECANHCTSRKGYETLYQKDKHFGSRAYAVGRQVSQIQTEIMRNGPVEAGFEVFEDFYRYRSGVYVHTGGASLGGHAVKILGWGVDRGTPYWLVANSWNINWGEKGYFRIRRGSNECGIEAMIVAGVPDFGRAI